MTNSLDFETKLLACMPAEYQRVVVKEAQLNSEWIQSIDESRRLKLPPLIGVPIAQFEQLLGRSIRIHEIPKGVSNQDYARHDFSLLLWPKLTWSIASVDGVVFGVGFRSRQLPALAEFRADNLVPGEWCLDDLKELGALWTSDDGWGQSGKGKVELNGMRVLAEHCFGLIYKWEAA